MKTFKFFVTESRPSQRHPLEGHDYHKKTDAQLEYIAKDAHKAAEAMKGHNEKAENKYRDQANDSATVRYWRKKNGMPDWYKKKYGHMKEEIMTEAQTSKTGIVQTDVYGTKAYHAKCLEPGCKFESKRFDRIKQAQAAAQKHAKEHLGQNVKENVELDEMDKSQPSSSRGAEGLPLGKKAVPVKTDKVKSDVLKVLQKQYKKVKEEVEHIDEGEGIVTPRKTLHGEPPKGTYAYERKYGAYTAKGLLRKRPNPNKPPVEKKVNENLAADFLKHAHKSGFTQAKLKTGEERKKEFEDLMKSRQNAAKNRPATKAQQTPEKYPLGGYDPKSNRSYSEEVNLEEDWQKVNKADRTDGLSQKAVNAYRRENPGSKLQTAVTEKNPKGKRAKRRLSFCRRMGGMKKRLTNPENARDPDSPINKALRRWNC
jgi:hypothetical protein